MTEQDFEKAVQIYVNEYLDLKDIPGPQTDSIVYGFMVDSALWARDLSRREIDELKLKLADRSEKYKIFIDKGLLQVCDQRDTYKALADKLADALEFYAYSIDLVDEDHEDSFQDEKFPWRFWTGKRAREALAHYRKAIEEMK